MVKRRNKKCMIPSKRKRNVKKRRKDDYNYDEFDIETIQREFCLDLKGLNETIVEKIDEDKVEKVEKIEKIEKVEKIENITISEDKENMLRNGKLQKLLDVTRGISENKETYNFPITGFINISDITEQCSSKKITYDGNSNSVRCGLNIYDIDESPFEVVDKIQELNKSNKDKYTENVGFVKVFSPEKYHEVVNGIETHVKYDVRPVHIFIIYDDSITLLSFYKDSDSANRATDGSLILPDGSLIPQNDDNPVVRDIYVRDIIDEFSGFFRSTHIPSADGYTIESFLERHWRGI